MKGVIDGREIDYLWLLVEDLGERMIGGMMGMERGIFIVKIIK